MEHVKTVAWAEEQVKASWSLKWSRTYRPVDLVIRDQSNLRQL